MRPRTRCFTVGLFAGIVSWRNSGVAHAEHCELHELAVAPRSGYQVSVGWETARYRNSRYEGQFEGTSVAMGFRYQGFLITGKVPAYRLVRNGLPTEGMGDATLAMEQRVFSSADGHNALGARMALSIPTGAQSQDLGMGHSMVMPGVWARFQWQRLHGHLGLDFARAMGTTDSQHGGHNMSYFPIVQPMNMSELSATGLLELEMLGKMAIRTRLVSARPVASGNGTPRSIAGLGVGFTGEALSTYLEWQTPIEGTPFQSRMMGGLTISF